jgi:hypothetical protein
MLHRMRIQAPFGFACRVTSLIGMPEESRSIFIRASLRGRENLGRLKGVDVEFNR